MTELYGTVYTTPINYYPYPLNNNYYQNYSYDYTNYYPGYTNYNYPSNYNYSQNYPGYYNYSQNYPGYYNYPQNYPSYYNYPQNYPNNYNYPQNYPSYYNYSQRYADDAQISQKRPKSNKKVKLHKDQKEEQKEVQQEDQINLNDMYLNEMKLFSQVKERVQEEPRDDSERAQIAKDNSEIEPLKFLQEEGKTEIIDEEMHEKIKNELGQPIYSDTPVDVDSISSIQAAINSYEHEKDDKICILNFADPYKPGGGYINGRVAQEECICRQTLLYRSIKDNEVYENNKKDRKSENSDNMLYSPNIPVIRDDSCKLFDPSQIFRINIISSAAVDNRRHDVSNPQEIMEERIRKIITLAAWKKNDVLILGAFGCGVFKNNVNDICDIFAKILIEEGMKNYFKKVYLPVLTQGYTYKTLKSDLMNDS